MAERIEYQGDSLPSGLPGFGGGSVSVLTLPGFNRVVSVQTFGPAVDAPNVIPPDPTPPAGNTPENPATGPVSPSPAPAPQSTGQPSFCKSCESYPSQDFGIDPIIIGRKTPDICIECSGKQKVIGNYYSPIPAADPGGAGIFWGGEAEIRGDTGEDQWYVNHRVIAITADEDGQLKECSPKQIKVCVDGEVKTWWVLAYEEGEE